MFRCLHKILCRVNIIFFQHQRILPAYPPHISHFCCSQHFIYPFFISCPMHTNLFVVFFCKTIRHFSQSLCRRYAHTNRNTNIVLYGSFYTYAKFIQVCMWHLVHIQESFIYAIHFHSCHKIRQSFHYPIAHISIKGVITAKHSHTSFFYLR